MGRLLNRLDNDGGLFRPDIHHASPSVSCRHDRRSSKRSARRLTSWHHQPTYHKTTALTTMTKAQIPAPIPFT
jgi:hypothetical protein